MKTFRNQNVFFALVLGLLISCAEQDDSGFSYYSDDLGFQGYSGGDQYAELTENPFLNVSEEPVSTFSIDADGASYSNIRRFILDDNQLPPKAAVRTEELINYFDLAYEFTSASDPISLNGEVSQCPWNSENKLIRIGIQGKPIVDEIPASNFVFLIDVSGSMGSEDKLELLKAGFKNYVNVLGAEDRVAIVTYAGNAGVTLASTSGSEKQKIKNAINSLGSGGSTAGAEGIITAYEIAEKNFIEGGNNRIIMGTDGDFNVGISNREELIDLIEKKRESGVYLTILGVGRGNLNDANLEQIANNGNGTYEYIDNISQLMKVFIYEKSKFFTVAKDVKVQVAFNEKLVSAYRLIGYENRLLAQEDFEDDSKDAGEIGADQNITALYEIVPAVGELGTELRSQPTFTIDFRYKLPYSDQSLPLTLDIVDSGNSFAKATDQMKFVASVASFGMLLTDSQYKGESTYDKTLNWLNDTNLPDENGFKTELKQVVSKAQTLN